MVKIKLCIFKSQNRKSSGVAHGERKQINIGLTVFWISLWFGFRGFPGLFTDTDTSEHIRFFLPFTFFHFSVVGSVRHNKLTHVTVIWVIAPWLILSSSENCWNHSILVKLLTFVDFCVFLCVLAFGWLLQCTYGLGSLSNGRTIPILGKLSLAFLRGRLIEYQLRLG